MSATEHLPVVVIGAAGALGSRLALQLGRTHHVRLIVRDPARLPAGLSSSPVAVADIRDPLQLRQALDELAGDGRLAGIVNAAGVVAFGSCGTVPPAIQEELFRTNSLPVLTMLDCAADLVADGGFVANLTGAAADVSVLGLSAYSASKAAAAAAMRVASREFRRRNILVLDVRPGHIATDFSARGMFGAAPSMGAGLDPDAVAARIVKAIADREPDLGVEAFRPEPHPNG